jgi:hypothetical protein
MINSVNFWEQTQGQWTIISENSNYFRAIETAFQLSDITKLYHVPNFNRDGSTLYIRTKDYCIRVSDRWGECGDCMWTLDRDHSEAYIVAKISYTDLEIIL